METGRVAVVRLPGVNCESETVRALRHIGTDAEVVRWNLTENLIDHYAGFVLPGGFSYQDRVRGGVIASREPVMEKLAEAAAMGRPILGICNGAQVLVESGLVPGIDVERVEAALAPNRMPGRTGYHCDWISVSHTGGRSFLSSTLKSGDVIPLPVAHGEGRFVSRDPGFFDRLLENGQIPLRYCEPDGRINGDFPHCPNGSLLAAAAVTNRRGNVVAMMPHPERALYLHHVPMHYPSQWAAERETVQTKGADSLFLPGPGAPILKAFAKAVMEINN